MVNGSCVDAAYKKGFPREAFFMGARAKQLRAAEPGISVAPAVRPDLRCLWECP